MGDGYFFSVAGLPVLAGVDGNGYYVTVAFQNVTVEGSPLVVVLDPPIPGTEIDRLSAASLLALVSALAQGAVVQPF